MESKPLTQEKNTSYLLAPSFLARAIAYLIDIIIIGLATAILVQGFFVLYFYLGKMYTLLPLQDRNPLHIQLFKQAVSLLVFTTYMGFSFWYSNGRTMGKKILGLRVMHPGGENWSLALSFGRALAYQISYLPFGLGFTLALFRKDQRTLHDILCGTQICLEALPNTVPSAHGNSPAKVA